MPVEKQMKVNHFQMRMMVEGIMRGVDSSQLSGACNAETPVLS